MFTNTTEANMELCICAVLMWICVSVLEGTSINIFTDGQTNEGWTPISLAPYFLYEPDVNCWKHFTFQVKACQSAFVHFMDNNDKLAYTIVVGRDHNKESQFRATGHPNFIISTLNELDCNAYKQFWVSWKKGSFVLGRGELESSDVMIARYATPYTVRYLRLVTYGDIGSWIIPQEPPPANCDYPNSSKWRLVPLFYNTTMTANITLTVGASTPGQCAITCHWTASCVSFVYNSQEMKCQGHGQNFNDVTEGQGHAHPGSDYYTTI